MSDKWDEMLQEYGLDEQMFALKISSKKDRDKSRAALRSAISAVEQENVGYKSMMQSEALEKLEPGQLIAIIHSKQDEIEKAESDFALCMEQYDHQQERACNAEASLHEANKDAERLSMVWYFWDYYNSVFRCIHCKQIETDSHLDTCAWILHRARLAKKEQG